MSAEKKIGNSKEYHLLRRAEKLKSKMQATGTADSVAVAILIDDLANVILAQEEKISILRDRLSASESVALISRGEECGYSE